MSYYVIKDHTPYTVPGVISAIPLTAEELKEPQAAKRRASEKSKLYWLSINNQTVMYVAEYLDVAREQKVIVTLEQFISVKEAYEVLASDAPFPLALFNFEYNGFFGKELPGSPEYTGKFVKWTSDPGIVLLACSDGKDRLVPTYAIDLPYFSLVAPQPKPRTQTTLFGSASRS
jgi:hypothetical protein